MLQGSGLEDSVFVAAEEEEVAPETTVVGDDNEENGVDEDVVHSAKRSKASSSSAAPPLKSALKNGTGKGSIPSMFSTNGDGLNATANLLSLSSDVQSDMLTARSSGLHVLNNYMEFIMTSTFGYYKLSLPTHLRLKPAPHPLTLSSHSEMIRWQTKLATVYKELAGWSRNNPFMVHDQWIEIHRHQTMALECQVNWPDLCDLLQSFFQPIYSVLVNIGFK